MQSVRIMHQSTQHPGRVVHEGRPIWRRVCTDNCRRHDGSSHRTGADAGGFLMLPGRCWRKSSAGKSVPSSADSGGASLVEKDSARCRTTRHFDSLDHDETLKATVEREDRSYSRNIPRELTAGIHEDMRLLRWKAAGLQKIGDALLSEAGDRLGALILPEAESGQWDHLVESPPADTTLRFDTGTESLLHLPWELLRIRGRSSSRNADLILSARSALRRGYDRCG